MLGRRGSLGYSRQTVVSRGWWADLNTTLKWHAQRHESSMLTPLSSSCCNLSSHPKQSRPQKTREEEQASDGGGPMAGLKLESHPRSRSWIKSRVSQPSRLVQSGCITGPGSETLCLAPCPCLLGRPVDGGENSKPPCGGCSVSCLQAQLLITIVWQTPAALASTPQGRRRSTVHSLCGVSGSGRWPPIGFRDSRNSRDHARSCREMRCAGPKWRGHDARKAESWKEPCPVFCRPSFDSHSPSTYNAQTCPVSALVQDTWSQNSRIQHRCHMLAEALMHFPAAHTLLSKYPKIR